MTVKAVIFDLDGTVTEPFFDFDAIRAEMGLAKDAGPVWEVMAEMSPERRRRAEQILDFHEKQAVKQSTLNSGVKETIAAIRARGIRVGILTRNRRCNVLAVAEKHGLEFDGIVDREDGPAKPDAFGVRALCKQFGVEPAETLVVGDYLFDMLSAKSAGAVAILFKNHHRAHEFVQHANHTIERIDQVLEIMNADR